MERSSLNRRMIREKVGKLQKITHFNADQIERLLRMHERIAAPKRQIEKKKFKDFLYEEFNMTSDLLNSRVCEVFDPDTRGGVDDMDFVKGMSVFLRGKETELIDFVFACYDLNKDGFLSKDEIYQFLKADNMRLSLDEEDGEAVKDLVDIVLKKMDCDRDGKISPKDYTEAVNSDSVPLTILGDCFPSKQETERFLEMING